MIKRTFDYYGRIVEAYYKPEVLAEFEKIKHTLPKTVITSSTMSRAYLAEKIVDAKTGEVLKDLT
jgi:predicted small secreted protein